MILFKKVASLRNWLENQPLTNENIGFVPTMGALHAGHLSLIEASKKENGLTICSIFVNPTQFNDPADFQKYPITIEKDILLLEEAGCDVIFLPSVNEIYPKGIPEHKHYDLGFIETVFDGEFRPGHFQGVCMVVERLLRIVLPNNLYLGQKDYQQCMVITKLIELMHMTDTIKVHICPTLREHNGLAMSSRNMRLSPVERETASIIFQSLKMIQEYYGKQSPASLHATAQSMLESAGLKPDYIQIVDAKNLSSITEWNASQKAVVLAAAFMNEVRLIDNMILN